MNGHHDHPPSPLEEDLVAYLDGELDVDATQRIEERLATDQAVRDELHQLERAWDLLDELPRAELDESFTRSTIEMVAISAEAEAAAEERRRPALRRRQWLVSAGCFLAAMLLGFVAVRSAWRDPDQALLDELPLLVRLDQYEQVDDVEFLRRMRDQQLLSYVPRRAPADNPPQFPSPTATMEARVEYVSNLEPSQRNVLAGRLARFQSLTPADQARLRQLHKDLTSAADSATLLAQLDTYYEWLKTLTPMERADLLSQHYTTRLDQVARVSKDQLRRESRLDSADVQIVAKWLDDRLRQRVASFDKDDARRKLFERAEVDKHEGAALFIAGRQMWRPGWGMSLFDLDSKAIEDLQSRLSPRAQAQYKAREPEKDKRWLVFGWTGQAMRASNEQFFDSLLSPVDEEELSDFFESLPERERKDLLELTSEQRRHELRMKYVADRFPHVVAPFAHEADKEFRFYNPDKGGYRGDGRGSGGRGFGPGPGRGNSPGGGPKRY
jgi:anti-sigma factor RsiW